MTQHSTPTQFKRVAIGQTFATKTGRFRKISGTKAFAIKPNGTGQTHKKLVLARSTACTLV